MSYPSLTMNQLALEINQIARDKGWYDRERPFPEHIALIHSELSEALESWRKADPWYYDLEGKPEGWGVELADTLIRILDLCHDSSIDIDHLVRLKMDYNKTRSYRHGNKRI